MTASGGFWRSGDKHPQVHADINDEVKVNGGKELFNGTANRKSPQILSPGDSRRDTEVGTKHDDVCRQCWQAYDFFRQDMQQRRQMRLSGGDAWPTPPVLGE